MWKYLQATTTFFLVSAGISIFSTYDTATFSSASSGQAFIFHVKVTLIYFIFLIMNRWIKISVYFKPVDGATVDERREVADAIPQTRTERTESQN